MSPAASPFRVLVVEDEPDIAALVAYHLTREGYRVDTASTSEEATFALAREAPDLVILDRMLPGIQGDDLLKDLRRGAVTRDLPVLILSAKRLEDDRIEGLEMGADDYLSKPFSPRELVLRVQSLLRRVDTSAVKGGGGVHRVGPLVLDPVGHRVLLDGDEVELTPTEFRLLKALMEQPDRTQSRRQLLVRAWDVESEVAEKIKTRTVDMHIQRLRTKLGEAGDRIETVRGFGYRLKR
jgi:two-component system, OmpR family, phosphate regulon response regulator PhoB